MNDFIRLSSMRCPKCLSLDTKVLDTRTQKSGENIRRRRECEKCLFRFSTMETLIQQLPMVIKKDGRREPFSSEKILHGLKAACQKRPIAFAQIEHLVDSVKSWVLDAGEKEVPSRLIGQFVMSDIKNLDEVAYIRFASVYKTFKDVNEFVADLSPEEALHQSQNGQGNIQL